jgi:P4 family phage/plasmid primase-like protien
MRVYTQSLCDAAAAPCSSTRKGSLGLHIAEMPHHVVPLVIDVDLNVDAGTEQDEAADQCARRVLYTLGDVRATYQQCVQVLERVVQYVPDTLDKFDALLLEKPGYVDSARRLYKNGYHLHFLNVYLTQADAKRVCRLVHAENSNVDTGVASNAWLMYGSSKSDAHAPYMATHLLRAATGEAAGVDVADVPYTLAELPARLSVQDPARQPLELVPEPAPRAQFVYGGGIVTAQLQRRLRRPSTAELGEPLDDDDGDGGGGGGGGGPAEVPLTEVAEALRYISSDRACTYATWTQIGWTLYNVTRGSAEGLALFDEFSRRAPNYNRSAVHRLWNSAQFRCIGMRTLVYYAMSDSAEYAALLRDRARRAGAGAAGAAGADNRVEKVSERFTHMDLAEIMYRAYKHEFVCASALHRRWFVFSNGMWRENDDAVTIRLTMSKYISGLLDTELEEATRAHNAELAQLNEGDEVQRAVVHSKYKAHVKEIHKCQQNIRTNAFKHSVLRECVDLFYDDTFLAKLDSNPYMIGFRNGVYDMLSNTFRIGTPEDYISKCMPVEYDETLTYDSPSVKAVHRLLEQLFPDRTLYQYFLDFYSDVMLGGNTHKLVHIWTAGGNNGKSVLQSFFEKLLGPYCIKLPTTLITGKRAASSSANPELVRTGGGVRLVFLQEPDKSEEINTGVLKELSGNDTFFARALYQSGGEITPMFKLVLVCNDPPKLPFSDEATWRRLRIMPFESIFVDHAHPDYNEQLRTKQFQKDKHLAAKLDQYTDAFAWVLLQRRRERCEAGTENEITEPGKVAGHTEDYRLRNDTARQFEAEMVAVQAGAKLHIIVLYDSYKEWHRASVGNSVPTKQEVKDMFSRLWGTPVNSVYWPDKCISAGGGGGGDPDPAAGSDPE